MKLLIYLIAIFYVSEVLAITDIEFTQSEKNLIMQGDIIVREVPTIDINGKTVEAIGLINATVDEVFQVLIRFEDYSSYKPHVTKVDILQCDKNDAILNYTISLPLGKTKRYRLRKYFENYGSSAVLKWEMLEWPGLKKSDTIKDTKGYWLVKNFPEKKGHVIVVYHVYTDPGPIPFGLEWIVDILTKNSVPEVVLKTREHIYKYYNKE